MTFRSAKLVSSAILPLTKTTASSSTRLSYFPKQSENAITSTCPPIQSISKNPISLLRLSYFLVIFVIIPPTVTKSFFLRIKLSEKSTVVNSSKSSECSSRGWPDTYNPSTSFSNINDFFSSHSAILLSSGDFIRLLFSDPFENKSTWFLFPPFCNCWPYLIAESIASKF